MHMGGGIRICDDWSDLRPAWFVERDQNSATGIHNHCRHRRYHNHRHNHHHHHNQLAVTLPVSERVKYTISSYPYWTHHPGWPYTNMIPCSCTHLTHSHTHHCRYSINCRHPHICTDAYVSRNSVAATSPTHSHCRTSEGSVEKYTKTSWSETTQALVR